MWQDFYPLKLLELWQILQERCPRTILELGSGCTTSVFAEYCKVHGKDEIDFWTVDESASFQASVLTDIASQHVRSAVLPPEKLRFGNPECDCIAYDGLDRLVKNGLGFLYVDGPANNEVPCADAAMMMDASEMPMTVMFDIRRTAVALVKANGHWFAYHWSLSCWQEKDVPWYLSAVRHHTVARRRV